VEAYRLDLKGIYHVSKWSPEGLQRGIEFLRQALEVDPVYPAAYSGLGYVYVLLGCFGMIPPRDSFPKAKSAALRALEVEANHVNAHLVLNTAALFFDWDWKQFESYLHSNALGAKLSKLSLGAWLWIAREGPVLRRDCSDDASCATRSVIRSNEHGLGSCVLFCPSIRPSPQNVSRDDRTRSGFCA
jgi:hypothetical protein